MQTNENRSQKSVYLEWEFRFFGHCDGNLLLRILDTSLEMGMYSSPFLQYLLIKLALFVFIKEIANDLLIKKPLNRLNDCFKQPK